MCIRDRLVTEGTSASLRTGVTNVDRTALAIRPRASVSRVHIPTPASPVAIASWNFARIDWSSSKWTSRQVPSPAFQYWNHDPSGAAWRSIGVPRGTRARPERDAADAAVARHVRLDPRRGRGPDDRPGVAIGGHAEN